MDNMEDDLVEEGGEQEEALDHTQDDMSGADFASQVKKVAHWVLFAHMSPYLGLFYFK